MAKTNASIVQTYNHSPGVTGPYRIPAQQKGQTSVLVRYTTEMAGEDHVYQFVTYAVGPCAAKNVTLASPATCCVLIDLPDGTGTNLGTIGAVFGAGGGVTPDDPNPPPPAPGIIHGGNQQ